MSTQSILTWVLTATTRLLPSQSKTLAVLVAAALRCERPNLAQIGRGIAGPVTAKSAIKRAWRFTCNPRIEVADAMAEVIQNVKFPAIWRSSFEALRRTACNRG